jgi:hypothetical protein
MVRVIAYLVISTHEPVINDSFGIVPCRVNVEMMTSRLNDDPCMVIVGNIA